MARKLYIYILTILLSIAFIETARAQFYVTGESPARAKWNQIKTPHYKVIYPQGIDSLARRYAGLLESARPMVMAGLLADPKPIPVILHPYTTVSNGMVVWAPKRAELYTMPPADGEYCQNWERQLVLHESRHVGQMSHFTKGIYKPLNWFLGEQITGLGVGVFASRWLLEGDAVVAETELTDGGRGRSASFFEHYRASLLSGESRSWYKWRYGCYKHYTPNVYALGYMINSTARLKSGNYLYTGELLNTYVKRFYNPNVVGMASKKVAGAKPKGLFEEGMEYHAKMWRDDYQKRKPYTESQVLPHKGSGYYYEYNSPVAINGDTVVCIKYSYDNPTALVMLSSNEKFRHRHRSGEKLIRAFSNSTSNLEPAAGKLFWTETVSDARWGKESFNNLYSYDLDSRKITKLSNNSSYNNPRASLSGDSLSVVEYPLEGGSNLVILDSRTGEKLYSVAAPSNGQLTECAWIGSKLYALAITGQGLGLFSMDMETPGEWSSVISEQPKTIKSLQASGGKLYFESDIDGVNDVYEFNPENEELVRVVKSEFGAHDPYVSGNRVYYSNLSSNSMQPSFSELGMPAEKPGHAPFVKDGKLFNSYKYIVADSLSGQAGRYFKENGIMPDTTAAEWEVKRYRKGTHLFRFHSWAPVYYNVDKIMSMSFDHLYEVVSLGATAYSQNSLGTAVTMLGYSYRKGRHAAHASFEYSGLLPVFKISADYNTSDSYEYKIETVNDTSRLSVTGRGIPLFNLSAQAYIPVNLSSHGWQRGLIPQIAWQYENNAFYSRQTRKYDNRQQITYALQYYQMRPVANSAIFPKWGFSATIKGAVSPEGHENFGSAFSAYSYIYLPGFMKRQGIRLSATYQKQYVEDKYMYLDNLVEMPRGHESHYGAEYYKFSADYAIPVNLRGFNLGFLAYFKRLQIIPFAYVAGIKGVSGGYSRLYSYGADLLLDAIICHIGIPFSFGLRYARTNDPGKPNHVGFLSSISLF